MKSAEQNITSFLKENPSVYSASVLERMSFANKNGTLANPKAISRRLQENAEEGGVLQVTYDEHGGAMYQIKAGHEKPKVRVIDDSLPPIKDENGQWRGQFKFV